MCRVQHRVALGSTGITGITCWHRLLLWHCSTAHTFLLVIASFLQHCLTLTCRFFVILVVLLTSILKTNKKKKNTKKICFLFSEVCASATGKWVFPFLLVLALQYSQVMN